MTGSVQSIGNSQGQRPAALDAPHRPRVRVLEADAQAELSIALPRVQELGFEGLLASFGEDRHGQGGARLLATLIHHMGGAPTSVAPGLYLRVTV